METRQATFGSNPETTIGIEKYKRHNNLGHAASQVAPTGRSGVGRADVGCKRRAPELVTIVESSEEADRIVKENHGNGKKDGRRLPESPEGRWTEALLGSY